jgi:hypothetical protein
LSSSPIIVIVNAAVTVAIIVVAIVVAVAVATNADIPSAAYLS